MLSNKQQAPGGGCLGDISEPGSLEILKPDAACEGEESWVGGQTVIDQELPGS